MQRYSLLTLLFACGIAVLAAMPVNASEEDALPVRSAAVIDNGKPASDSEVRRNGKRKNRNRRNRDRRDDRHDRHDRYDRHDRHDRHHEPESRRWYVDHADAGDVHIDDMYMRIAEDGTWKFAAEFDTHHRGHHYVHVTWHFYETRGKRRYHLFEIDVEFDIHGNEFREVKGYFDRHDFDYVDYAHYEAHLD